MQQGALTLLLAAVVALVLWWSLPGDNPSLGRLADLPCEIEAPAGISIELRERRSNMAVIDEQGKDRSSELSMDVRLRVTNISPKRVSELKLALELRDGDVVLESHRWGKAIGLEAGQVERVRFVNAKFDAGDVLKADRLAVVVRF